MHATIEQLLEIRDGLQNDASFHLQGCAHCKAELGELALLQLQLKQQMVEPGNCQPSSGLWQRISHSASAQRLAGKQGLTEENSGARSSTQSSSAREVPVELLVASSQRQNSLSRAIYALAASILVTGFIGLYMFGQQGPGQQQDQFMQASIQDLMLDSRGMERALQKVALQKELLTVAERSVADRLYWRLAYVDQMIHDNDADGNDPVRIEALWNERVDALTELNQLYYQRQQALDESEI